MNRRDLLATIGTGAVGIADPINVRKRGRGQETPTAESTPTSDGFDGIASTADQPFATILVGSRQGVRNPENNQPHTLRIWNDAESARSIGLRLFRGGTGATAALDRTVEFPADGYLTLRLLEPAEYGLSVSPGGRGDDTATENGTTGERIAVPRQRFDCNDSVTEIAVGEDGTVRFRTVSTEIGCAPEVVGQIFTAFQGDCGSRDTADVGFGDGSVELDGAIQAPTPCYGAELAEVAVTGPDEVRVTIATTEPTADICVECIGSIEYDAVLTFRDRVPARVTVRHQRGDEVATVAQVTRDDATVAAEDSETPTEE
jgi:hypothetical protein